MCDNFGQTDLPIAYVHGANGPLFEKIEQALEGRQAGDKVEVLPPPQDGFGEHKPELTFTDDIGNVPPEHRRLGSEVLFENERGEQMQFRVTRIEDGRLTVDANHPLAGQTADSSSPSWPFAPRRSMKSPTAPRPMAERTTRACTESEVQGFLGFSGTR